VARAPHRLVHVLALAPNQADLLAARREQGVLGGKVVHQVDRQELLDPLVVGDQLVVPDGPLPFLERRQVRARRDAVVVQGGAAHARGLEHQAGAVPPANPRSSGTVGRPPPEAAVDDGAHVVLEAAEVAVRVEPRPGLQHQHPDAALGELLGHDRAAGTGADHDDVGMLHQDPFR
jgi:hypothetical protein